MPISCRASGRRGTTCTLITTLISADGWLDARKSPAPKIRSGKREVSLADGQSWTLERVGPELGATRIRRSPEQASHWPNSCWPSSGSQRQRRVAHSIFYQDESPSTRRAPLDVVGGQVREAVAGCESGRRTRSGARVCPGRDSRLPGSAISARRSRRSRDSRVLSIRKSISFSQLRFQ